MRQCRGEHALRLAAGPAGSALLIGGVVVTLILMMMTAMGGCHADHPQSMVHPSGPAASHVAALWWFLFGVLTAVFIITMILMVMAICRKRREGEPFGRLGASGFVALSGIVLPAILLIALLIASLRSTVGLRTPEAEHTIHIIGHQFWWEVRYPEADIVTANEIHLPVGEPVRLKLTSADVIHSLWVPNLTGKMDLVPGRTNIFWIQSDEAGVFRGQCAEYCGTQHAKMALQVVALPGDEFQSWLAAQVEASARAGQIGRSAQHDPGEIITSDRPADRDAAPLARGRSLFFGTAGCDACHSIRGTAAQASIGPDLTLIGARRSLAANTLPNTPEHLAAWILDPHRWKPGSLMPATAIEPDELEALVAYLRALGSDS